MVGCIFLIVWSAIILPLCGTFTAVVIACATCGTAIIYRQICTATIDVYDGDDDIKPRMRWTLRRQCAEEISSASRLCVFATLVILLVFALKRPSEEPMRKLPAGPVITGGRQYEDGTSSILNSDIAKQIFGGSSN